MRPFARSRHCLFTGVVVATLGVPAMASNFGVYNRHDLFYDPPRIPYLKVDDGIVKVFKEDVQPIRRFHEYKDRFFEGVDVSTVGMDNVNGDIDESEGEKAAEIPKRGAMDAWTGKLNNDNFELIIPNATKSFVFLPETRMQEETVTTKKIIPDTEVLEHFSNGDFTGIDVTTESVVKKSLAGAGLNNATRIDINGVHFRDINYITPTGLNAGSQKVVNVEDGLIAHGSKDAINGGQLYDELQKLKAGNVNWNRINRMGAMAAALAGLHPMEYDERHRFSVSAAYGNYKNGHGLAAGLYYRPDHRMMVSAGLAVSPGGDKMLNLGASYRLGAQKNEYASTFKDFASSEVAHQITINLRHVKEDLDEHKADVKAWFVQQRALDDQQTRRLQAQAREIRELKAQLAKEVQAFTSYREKMTSQTQALEARLAQVEALLKK